MSKYELSISTGYVKNWGIVEAVRELYQNALDNEIENPENKMGSVYNKDIQELRISNKTSSLEKDSLLLGTSTKAGNNRTIGQHGEGYKIAFMVLLRNGKTVTVYNYGKKEVWKASLMKSRRYNNQEIPVITVEKHVWTKVPDNDLTIVVGGITEDEYVLIKNSNLNLRDYVRCLDFPDRGRILLDESEKGNIYVKGLFVANKRDFEYGYDLDPSRITLDRDRRILDSIRIAFETSELWNNALILNPEYRPEFLDLFHNEKLDVRYCTESYIGCCYAASDLIASDFFEEYGGDAVPVISNEEFDDARFNGRNPVIVSSAVAEAIKRSSVSGSIVVVPQSIKKRLEDFKKKIADRLTEEELEEFRILIAQVKD